MSAKTLFDFPPTAEVLFVGRDGYVQLLDVMGNDAAVVNAARVSRSGSIVTTFGEKEQRLIQRMLLDGHTTPFEMCELKFYVRVPMDTWRQWVRHRTATICEYSTRYRPAIDGFDICEPCKLKKQQGSLTNPRFAEAKETRLHKCLDDTAKASQQAYRYLLTQNLAREQARRILPLCTYTEAYWKIDLHNLLHFLELRMSEHAQTEIREYALAVFTLLRPHFPITCFEFSKLLREKETWKKEMRARTRD